MGLDSGGKTAVVMGVWHEIRKWWAIGGKVQMAMAGLVFKL
jgi:hypothetical protein